MNNHLQLLINAVFALATLLGMAAPAAGSDLARTGQMVVQSTQAVYSVTSAADSGAGTLRQAILDANANPGPDTITFAIGTAGSQQTIALTSALPTFTDPAFVDGWSQGGGGYSGPPLIEINGSGIASWNTVNGLEITGGSSTVRGLAINYFNIGIRLTTAGNNIIAGNYIGLALDGNTAVGNRTGISITDTSEGNRIGTNGDGLNDVAERNVISASGFVQQNNSSGILIAQGSDNHWIAGNYIGTDAAGTQDRGNAVNGITTGGIAVIGTNGDGVGDDMEGNLISGNNGHGIALSSASSGSSVAGNKIGTDVTGTVPLPNNSNGVGVGSCSPGQCSDYIFGTNGDGVSDGLEGNLISGNGASGVYIPSGTIDNNVIAGNKIGTDISGAAGIPNNDYGVHLGGDFSRLGTNTDGTSDNLEGNLISGNGVHGVLIPSGADHNRVAGNRIGTSLDGTAALPNAQTGLRVEDDHNTLTGNLISGNQAHGIHVYDAFFNIVTDNLIGAAADGVTPLGNTQHGIYIAVNSDDNLIGGTGVSDGNLIAHNGGDGVFVDSSCGAAFCVRNRITANSIFENGGLGIDLAPNGVDANDLLDTDSGANTRQNYPVLSAAASVGTNLIITGTLNSSPNLTFTLDFYSSAACDPSGSGEGATYLGAGQVTTDASGDAAFSISTAGLAQDGDAVSATASDPDGSTSEFSGCVQVFGEEPILGLQAANDSPTFQGAPTYFTASLTSGTGVSYAWDFGDGEIGSGVNPSHVYPAAGSYTATVTASNNLGSMLAATSVTILPPPACAATHDNGLTVFGSQDAVAVQQAVDAAQVSATVKIAGTCAGVSSRNSTTQTVHISNTLTLVGGYSLDDWANPDPTNTPTVLDALGMGRVIFITSTFSTTINLENLTLANGSAIGSGAGACPDYGCGGGLFTNGSLALKKVRFQNNQANRAGGAYVSGLLAAVDSDWLDNTGTTSRGGGLEVYGDAVITGGLWQGNAGLYAGAMYAHSGGVTLVISGTQFISNTATSLSAGSGGAIYAAGTLNITNALFAGNQSQTGSGALQHSPGESDASLGITNTQFISNTTLNNAAQGGALSTSASASMILSSTFQGNSAPGSLGAGGAIVAFKAITLTETALISNTAGGQGGAIYHWGLSESGDTTQVYPLVIMDSLLAGNQAGGEGGGLYFRQGWEANNIPVHVNQTTFKENIASLNGGGVYLGQPGRIAQATFVDNHSAAAGGGLFAVDAVQIAGSSFAGNTATRAGGAYVTGTLDAQGATWQNNTCDTVRGGAVEVYGAATFTGGLVQGNACRYAGGIFASAGLIISGTQFIGNTATSQTTGSGGAVYSSGDLNLTNALFEGNQSYTGAGAVQHSPGNAAGSLVITNTRFVSNTALNTSAQGGALSAGAASSTIMTSTFQNNSLPGSAGAGGAIVAYQAMTLTATTLLSNTVGGQGGAIYHWGLSEAGQVTQITPLIISGSSLAGNHAGNQGGGLYFRLGFEAANTPVHISATNFWDNAASQEGGGVYLSQPAFIEESSFRGNSSLNASGGGIFASSLLMLDSSTLIGNRSGTNGGGLALQSSGASPSQITNSVFSGNTTSTGGASLYVSGARPVNILHSTLTGADTAAQGIVVDGTDLQITNAILVSHTVGILASGGGVVGLDHTLFHANQEDVQGATTNLNPIYGDPKFLDAAMGDFHLTLGSPAIDAGAITSVLSDFEADLRPIINQSDLGADEFGDSTVADPGAGGTVIAPIGSGRQVIIMIPPGGVSGRTIIRLLPVFPPSVQPPPTRLTAGTGFIMQATPEGGAPASQTIVPTFLLPVEITVTYLDTDMAGLDENSLILVVLDEASGEWVDASTTCSQPGAILRSPDENRITISTCASGEFALLGSTAANKLYLPLIGR